MKIGRKLAIGYTVIVALIGGIVYTYLREWRQMVSLESEIKQIHEARQSVHEAYVHMLDLTMFGETILEWEKADTAIYRAKRHKVDSILCDAIPICTFLPERASVFFIRRSMNQLERALSG